MKRFRQGYNRVLGLVKQRDEICCSVRELKEDGWLLLVSFYREICRHDMTSTDLLLERADIVLCEVHAAAPLHISISTKGSVSYTLPYFLKPSV